MNILLTGASRGIGAATFDLFTANGHNVAGHSTRGGDGLIAGDLADPAAARAIWEAALDRLGGRIDVLVNNAGIYEGVGEDASEGNGRPLGAAPSPSTWKARPASAASPSATSGPMAAAASSMSPAARPIAAIRRSIGTMPRPNRP